VPRPLIAALSPSEAKLVSQDIRYLNMDELRRFCDRHGIPYVILVEKADGRLVRSRDRDRKGIVVERVLRFVREGVVGRATIFRRRVVADGPLGRTPVASDPVLYGQYKNRDPGVLELMKSLTDGEFEFGAIAQEVLRTCWSKDEAPTYAEFATLWSRAVKAHRGPNPEWAFLKDRADKTSGPDWKQLRSRRAAAVIALLERG
jgi:hypothetical protein